MFKKKLLEKALEWKQEADVMRKYVKEYGEKGFSPVHNTWVQLHENHSEGILSLIDPNTNNKLKLGPCKDCSS